ncbi:MAG TPA: glucose-6-phosphate dehydrogenase, partial [Polyangiaceae bacterium]|nr:glucose-6-phosphate dehydrogenase [Polyangiaceae bacterium]
MSRADAFVFFGATGDLAHKKIFPALGYLVKSGRLNVPIIGLAREGWNLERLVERARDSLRAYGGFSPEIGDKLCSLMRYVDGDYRDLKTFERLRQTLDGAQRPLFYMAVPPSLFIHIVKSLQQTQCAREGRLVVEKPFGHNLESARELNRAILEVFPEDSLFRIDHYLGKEAVENLCYFRFANSIFEPLWHRHFIDSVQITMAESFGVQSRGSFYDQTGAIRDVLQNHLLQVAANLAMEQPAHGSSLREE